MIDRATTGDAERGLYLRFRVPGKLALDGDVGTATVGPGGTKLAIAELHRTSGQPELAPSSAIDCFKGDPPRGKCDAARFAVTDYRLELAGSEARAVHVISATGGAPARATSIGGEGWSGVRIGGVRDAVVVWPRKPGAPLAYRAPRGKLVHVILDAAETGGKSTVTAAAEGDECAVRVAAGGELPSRPAIVMLDEACAIAGDPPAASAAPAGTKPPPVAHTADRARRSGCCGAQPGPETPLAAAAVAGLLLRRRRRPGRGARESAGRGQDPDQSRERSGQASRIRAR